MVELRPERVTVAIPAYNAAATLDETLRSVRQQSYLNLEILVVDDGSTDATPAIAHQHAANDPRVTVICKANGGVASARNEALDRATGALFATVDADDLWHPDKITHQVNSLRYRSGSVVLNYTWFVHIDSKGRVLSTAEPSEEGRVLPRMCRGNLIGNGSSPVMLTSVLRSVGGWDVGLRGGNEDYKTFFLLAERGNFTVVRSYLVGYRQGRESRSSKAKGMLLSYDQILAEIGPRHPEHADQFAAGRHELIAYLFDKAILNQNWHAAAYLLREALTNDKANAASMVLAAPLVVSRMVLPLALRARLRARRPGETLRSRPFLMESYHGQLSKV
jgi:glycosyltransferase involved in cell wall biosynthesis